MSTVTYDDRPRRVSGGTVREAEETRIVQQAEPAVQVALNPTAFALWQLCDGCTTVAEMVEAVYDLFDVTPDQAERDVFGGIEQMRSAGIVR